MIKTLLPLALLIGSATAATWDVAQTSIQAAVDKANPGDTILIHAGVYRESVKVTRDNLTITAAPGEIVTLTGADVIPPDQWENLPGKPILRHAPWKYHGPTHPNDARHHLIGRTEQVIADGQLLRQVEALDQLESGTFFADPGVALFVWPPAGYRQLEASVRPDLMTVTGSHVIVRGVHFRYASNPAQHAAFDLSGASNVAEDCLVEWTNGVGAKIEGDGNTFRRVVSRFNGQMGMSGRGTGNTMEECTLEGNNVKGYNKGWEAGGIKVVLSRNFKILRSRAVRNDGPGFWFDIDNREELVENSYSAENNGPGFFAEISETATFRKNLAVRNGLKNESGAWGHAGFLLGEAMHCTVEKNISVGNRVGIEIRQQRVRTLPGKEYFSDGHVFWKNISAFNTEWQFALVGDNAFFGAKKEVSPEDLERLDPGHRGYRAEDNVYYAAPGEGLILWGAKWLPKHLEYSDLKKFAAEHGLDASSIVVDPGFPNRQGSSFADFALPPSSPAAKKVD